MRAYSRAIDRVSHVYHVIILRFEPGERDDGYVREIAVLSLDKDTSEHVASAICGS